MSIELENKIKKLEEELDIFRKKEHFINESALVAKNDLEVSRFNSEKIILKSINEAWKIKLNIIKIVNLIQKNKDDYSKVLLEIAKFLNENKLFLEIDQTNLQKKSEQIAEKIVSEILLNKKT